MHILGSKAEPPHAASHLVYCPGILDTVLTQCFAIWLDAQDISLQIVLHAKNNFFPFSPPLFFLFRIASKRLKEGDKMMGEQVAR